MLPLILGVLMVLAVLELAFITSMVGWLHGTAKGTFAVRYNGKTFDMAGEPKGLLVDQGHTSNAAAGTALVIVGIGGLLSLWLRSFARTRSTLLATIVSHTWLVLNVESLLLLTGALIYTFAVTNEHKGQTIDVALASTLDGDNYPIHSWTPQNWFSAVLDLDLADDAQRDDISKWLRIMQGWQYNLIPLFIVHLGETVFAMWYVWDSRRVRGMIAEANTPKREVSPPEV